jgi:DNA (cytosine-5)-methyltransferase 1
VPTVGSLFSGAGLLDLGLHLAGFEHAWLCESDPWRRGLLRARFPGVPVFDDIRTLRGQAAADARGQRLTERAQLDGEPQADGEARAHRGHAERRGVEVGAQPVDLIAGGFPCKGASSAGKRNGFEHPETALWFEMRRIIDELEPRYVLIENVGDIRGMAAASGEPAGSLWGTVLGDLATLGFDARWDCVPAAAVGAPHLRDRLFCVAAQSARADAERYTDNGRFPNGRTDAAGGGDRPAADADAAHGQGHGSAERVRAQVPGDHRDGAEPVANADGQRRHDGQGLARGGIGGKRWRTDPTGIAVDWGAYAPAIRRWEAVHGAAPEPLVRRVDDGSPGVRRVRARVDRSRLSALGDGVHVYVAWLVGLVVRDMMGA